MTNRTHAELLEALHAPLLDGDAAHKRLTYLCTSDKSEAVCWRASVHTDPVVALENARLREAIARDQIHRLTTPGE